MKKTPKIIFNLTMLLVIIGFVWYMAASVNKEKLPNSAHNREAEAPFDSPYQQVSSFELPEEINRFELRDNRLFISAGQSVYIYDTEGNQLTNFTVGEGVRDITVDGAEIYILYPARIAVFSLDGQPLRQWEAYSNRSDYCSFTLAGDALFVTDAENKYISKYDTEGYFERFIKSPAGFIIPSYSFDIDSWNDTIYCVNSGRHRIETYTIGGSFIAAFGSHGSEAGLFAGCCNPVYISFASCGTLITSEKGNPRISSFERNGKFKEMWLNSKMLGGGNKAYQVRAIDDKLLVAGNRKIMTFKIND